MIFDLHNDFPTVLCPNEYGDFISSCESNVITAAIWTSAMAVEHAAVTVENTVRTLKDLKTKRPLPIAIEDIGFLFNGDNYRMFDFSALFYCSLTWNTNNGFAGGALDDGRLTKDGVAVVKRMNGNCAVDVAHLNKKSFYDVLDAAETLICSHTGFNAHPRSLDGDQINALIARKAVIGLSAVVAFTGARSMKDWVHVIDDFVQTYENGIDCLAIGTDFYGTVDLPHDLQSYDAEDGIRHGLSDLGYASADIDKILFDNANNFYKTEK